MKRVIIIIIMMNVFVSYAQWPTSDSLVIKQISEFLLNKNPQKRPNVVYSAYLRDLVTNEDITEDFLTGQSLKDGIYGYRNIGSHPIKHIICRIDNVNHILNMYNPFISNARDLISIIDKNHIDKYDKDKLLSIYLEAMLQTYHYNERQLSLSM